MNEPANEALPTTLRTPSEPSAGAPSHAQPVVPEHRLLRCIGQGAYGEVWLAQNAMGTFRAVKVVYRDSFRDEQPYEREFKGIQRFEPVSRSHDGFVDILQVGRNDEAGYFYYVMELADDGSESRLQPEASGEPVNEMETMKRCRLKAGLQAYTPKTLNSELQRRGRLPFDECLQLALSLNLTLGHLHRRGLIHRDIKPSNIIFVNGIPKLADVGLVTDVSEARTFVGTEGFIPPEGPNSLQADIYSLGKVLYEISMGKDRKQFPEPFTGLGEVENSAALAELNAVIVKACATDPSERYQSTEEMHLDLALLHGGKSVRKKRMLERRLALLTRLSVVAFAVTTLVVAGYVYQQRQTQKANRLAAELQITHGIHVLDQGDLAGSLLWFVKAFEQARWTKEETEMHRFRLGAVLQHCPRLVQLFLHEKGPGRIDFSSDGRRLLTYFWTTNVQVFDVATGESLAVLRHSNQVWHAAFSHDGERVVSLSGVQFATNAARVWNVSTGQPIGPPIWHSARSQRVITDSDEGAAQIWDALAGVKLGPNLNHTQRVAFSRDGKSVITASSNTVQIWNPESGEPNGPALRHLQDSDLLGVSPDGRSVLTARDQTAYLWDLRTREALLPPLKHTFPSLQDTPRIIFGKFSSGGEKILVVGWGGLFRQVWDAKTGAALLARTFTLDADFSPDGHWVAFSDEDSGLAQIFEASTGTPITSPVRHSEWGVRFHPDGRRFATANVEKLVRLWDIASGQFSGPVLRHTKRVTWAGFSPDGHRILTASWDGTARLWDAATGKEVIPALEHRGFRDYGRPSFSRDGKRVLTASATNTVQWWEADTGEPFGQAMRHQASVHHAELSPDGKLVVTTTEDGSVQLWNAHTGEQVGPPIPTHATFASFSPDGRRLATIGGPVQPPTWAGVQAQVWDVMTRQPLTPGMPINAPPSYSVSFSPDGKRILTRGGGARVWDAHSGRPESPRLMTCRVRLV